MPEVSARKLGRDCTVVMHDVEDVVRTMARQATQRIGDLRERRKHLADGGDAPALTELTAELVHDPWPRVALAAGIGLIAGLILRPIVKRMV